MLLNQALEDKVYIVSSLNLANNIKMKLLALGIDEKSEINLLKNIKGNVVVGINHSRIALGKNISGYIEVSQ